MGQSFMTPNQKLNTLVYCIKTTNKHVVGDLVCDHVTLLDKCRKHNVLMARMANGRRVLLVQITKSTSLKSFQDQDRQCKWIDQGWSRHPLFLIYSNSDSRGNRQDLSSDRTVVDDLEPKKSIWECLLAQIH